MGAYLASSDGAGKCGGVNNVVGVGIPVVARGVFAEAVGDDVGVAH